MAIRVALNHRTAYTYDRPVTLLPQVVRLRPAPHCRTPILSYSLKVLPQPHYLNWQQDPYSNYLGRLVFPKLVREFSVEVDLIAELTTINPFDFFIESTAERVPFAYDPLLAKELTPYLEMQPAGPQLAALVASLRRGKIRTIDHLVEINQRLQSLTKYIVRMEPGIQACEETLTLGTGSCRDSAWLLVQVLRHLGMAARFASGYLIQLAADVKSLDGPSGPTSDFTDLHAWAEVYIPGAGWIGLDATSGLLTGEGHIPLACAADPTSAAPITGAVDFVKDPAIEGDKLNDVVSFSMTVTRIHEDPRVTKPYTDEQWIEIEALGHRVDERLTEKDVRLTMGGEPTFVSIDDRDGEEWNTAALGPHKRERAGELLRRLRDRFAPGALLHFGQGKWYPGESLPRWALGCFWRKDAVPVWKNPALIAEDDHDYGSTEEDAQRFIAALAGRLGVDASFAVPGYEDVWHYLQRERQLPIDVDPLNNKLDNPEERARLARIFEQGLGKIVGFALPLRKIEDSWNTSRWLFRRERMFLLPGDSPMGFRLPLDSLPWEAPAKRATVIDPDPSISRGPLANRFPQTIPVAACGLALGAKPQAVGGAIIRTALCIEPRGGKLFVFMPPQEELENYLELVAAIEATAAHLGVPVQIEGYEPPHDARLPHVKITPDPGVIEVNIHPSADWDELVEKTTILYEEAHLTRLTTEKFMMDGRHTGTGGGNHIVIGGPTTLDSPILRRPDLLRSLIGYWHNHPSLSYLFSGMFVGPTSQAPRFDEARNDSIYEMELAFKQVPERDSRTPWLVDRIFRNLLIDMTGNTHRAEFCIDKLYSPDSASGRLGLVELRAFEMPPHNQMSLVQHLLLRSLIARFWEQPYQQRLVRWGTELHDRFMLPHFVNQDLQDVLADLRQAGFSLRKEWFLPHFEFRFPTVGRMAPHGIKIEFRHAIEPWHVLGEEGTPGGTARYVDSSVERLQIKVNGLIDSRHIIAVNGRKVPLHPTGTNGEFVAGVRYRAWQPPSCLHPTIPVHSPLIFDILDKWQGRSLGACSYHVSHPGGQGYEILPVNSSEAESRRNSRFLTMGHTPGRITLPPEEAAPEAPFTLDLRRPVEDRHSAPRKPALTEPLNGKQNGIWYAEPRTPIEAGVR